MDRYDELILLSLRHTRERQLGRGICRNRTSTATPASRAGITSGSARRQDS